MPPLALISSMASTAPSRKFVPDTAPAPDSSMTIGMLTVCCASAVPAPSASSNAMRLFMVLLPLARLLRCLGDDVGLDDGPQFGRDLRVAAEPFAKAESRLLQQHAQAVDRTVAALFRLGEERRLQWHVDDVVDHRALL